MGEAFPELTAQKTLITSVIKEEEQSFLATLEAGLKRLDSLLVETSNKQLSGEKAFELYDTFGFPIDLTALILSEKGYTYDEKGFKEALAAQKQRSKADATSEKSGSTQHSDWLRLRDATLAYCISVPLPFTSFKSFFRSVTNSFSNSTASLTISSNSD